MRSAHSRSTSHRADARPLWVCRCSPTSTARKPHRLASSRPPPVIRAVAQPILPGSTLHGAASDHVGCVGLPGQRGCHFSPDRTIDDHHAGATLGECVPHSRPHAGRCSSAPPRRQSSWCRSRRPRTRAHPAGQSARALPRGCRGQEAHGPRGWSTPPDVGMSPVGRRTSWRPCRRVPRRDADRRTPWRGCTAAGLDRFRGYRLT